MLSSQRSPVRGPSRAPRKRPIDSPLVNCAIVFTLALALRIAFIVRIRGTFLWGTLVADAQTYWDWASALIAGSADTAAPFFLAPLYPYLLAGFRLVAGDRLLGVLVIQCVVGSLAAVLLMDTTRRATTPSIGLAVGILAAVYTPFIFFDAMVLGESALIFLGALLLWCASLESMRSAPIRSGVAFGVIIGAMALGRGIHLILLPALAVLPLADARYQSRVLRVVAATAIALLVCAPATWHNWKATGRFIPLTYSLGFNLAVGNGPHANGTYVPPAGSGALVLSDSTFTPGGGAWDGRDILSKRLGREVGYAESSDLWLRDAVGSMRADPVRTLRVTGRKLLMLFNRAEYPQIDNPLTYQTLVGPIGLPVGGGFAFLWVFACIGLFATWHSGPLTRWYASYAGLTALAILPFFVSDRYRLHLVPPLMVLAGMGLASLRAVRTRTAHSSRQRAVLIGAIVGHAIAFAPVPRTGIHRERWGVALDLGERAFRTQQYAVAAEYLGQAAVIERQNGAAWVSSPTMTAPLASHAMLYARTLSALGQHEAAGPWFQRAQTLLPALAGSIPTSSNKSAGSAPSEAASLRALGISLAQREEFARAESVFAVLAARFPDQTFAWGAIIRIQIIQGRQADAHATMARAESLGWRGVEHGLHVAFLLAVEGRGAQALAQLRSLSPAEIEADPTLRNLRDVVLRESGRR